MSLRTRGLKTLIWRHDRDMVTVQVIRSKNPPCFRRDWAKFKESATK